MSSEKQCKTVFVPKTLSRVQSKQKQYNSTTDMQIRTGLVGHLRKNFHFTNYRRSAFARDEDHKHPLWLQTTRGPQVNLILSK